MAVISEYFIVIVKNKNKRINENCAQQPGHGAGGCSAVQGHSGRNLWAL